MTTETTPRASLRSAAGTLAAATIGTFAGVALAEVSHVMRWPRAVPYVVVGIAGLWLVSIGADIVMRRRRAAQ